MQAGGEGIGDGKKRLRAGMHGLEWGDGKLVERPLASGSRGADGDHMILIAIDHRDVSSQSVPQRLRSYVTFL